MPQSSIRCLCLYCCWFSDLVFGLLLCFVGLILGVIDCCIMVYFEYCWVWIALFCLGFDFLFALLQ